MATYSLEMRDGQCDETREIEADSVEEAVSQVASECQDWVSDGDWGDDGAAIEVGWTLHDEDGDEVDSGDETVSVEPNHESLISDAVGRQGDDFCGYDPDDHDWTSEGEGGCTENPGVWSTGGTSMVFHSHCKKCGLHRVENHTGSQRNPGEHDTVVYSMPDSWCAECASEECTCEPSYRLRSTVSGYSVVRQDGAYAEFLDSEDADEAMQRLISGDAEEDDYEWTEG